VPNLVGDLEGCMFRNRCSHAIPACATASEQLSGGAHAHACIRSLSERAGQGTQTLEMAE